MSALCQPCEVQDTKNNASVWCMFCDVPLCTSCHKHHKVLKITKNHRIIEIEDYCYISSFLSEIKTKCDHHPDLDKKYQCPLHKIEFCATCKKSKHSGCENIVKIETGTKGEQINSSLQSFLNALHSNISTMTKLCEERQSNIQKIESERTEFLDDIKAKRITINLALDALEKELKEKFETRFQFEKGKIEKEHKIYIETKDQLQRKYDQLKKILEIKPLSVLQAFYAKKRLQEQTHRTMLQILEFVEQNIESNIRCTISVKINNTNRFIQISDNFEISSVKPRNALSDNATKPQAKDNTNTITDSSDYESEINLSGKQLPGNILVKIDKKSEFADPFKTRLENVTMGDEYKESQSSLKFTCSNQFKIRNRMCTDLWLAKMCIKLLPNERLVFGNCSESSLLIYDRIGVEIGRINLNSAPRSIALVVDYNQLVVTTGEDVVITNIEPFNIETTFPQNDSCYGITVLNDQLVVNRRNKGLKIIDFDGNQNKNYGVGQFLHLATVNQNTLVYAERGSEEVRFLNIVNNRRDGFTCPNINRITGITTDEEENVYVSCDKTNTIHMLPRGLNKFEAILTSKDGIDQPQGIDFQNGVLCVINNDGSVYLYRRGVE